MMWKSLGDGICFGSLNVPLNPKFSASFYFEVKLLLGISYAERVGRDLVDAIFVNLMMNQIVRLGWTVVLPEVFGMRLSPSSRLGIYGMEIRY